MWLLQSSTSPFLKEVQWRKLESKYISSSVSVDDMILPGSCDFAYQSNFCLWRNYVYQIWMPGSPFWQELTGTFLQVLVKSLYQTFQKIYYFNKKRGTEKNGLLVFVLLYIQKCCWYSLNLSSDSFSTSSLRYFSWLLYFSYLSWKLFSSLLSKLF